MNQQQALRILTRIVMRYGMRKFASKAGPNGQETVRKLRTFQRVSRLIRRG